MADKNTRIHREIQWPSVLYYLYLHLSALIGLYLGIFQAKWTTLFYSNYCIYLLLYNLLPNLNCNNFHSNMPYLHFRP